VTVHKLKPFKIPTAEESAAADRRRLAMLEISIDNIRLVAAGARALQAGFNFECRDSAVWYLDQHLRDLIEALHAKYHAKE
jgi:hypothetical protein